MVKIRGIAAATAEAEVTRAARDADDPAAREAETTMLPPACSWRLLMVEAETPRGMQAAAVVACECMRTRIGHHNNLQETNPKDV